MSAAAKPAASFNIWDQIFPVRVSKFRTGTFYVPADGKPKSCSGGLAAVCCIFDFNRAISHQDQGIGGNSQGKAGQDSGDQFQVPCIIQEKTWKCQIRQIPEERYPWMQARLWACGSPSTSWKIQWKGMPIYTETLSRTSLFLAPEGRTGR